MRFRQALVGCLVLLLPLALFAGGKSADDSTVHGTINIALANQNGLVVLTDSMLSAGGHQLPEPGQKLFKLDERTVCSIAGFVSAPAASQRAAVPSLNTSTSATIHEYVRQSMRQPPQTILERMRALAILFRIHLSAIANVRDALGSPTTIESYRFQLIVAGYDLDGKLKVGKITFRTTNDHGALMSEIDEGSITNVEEKLVWKLNGMPDEAAKVLEHPELGPKDDTALNEYATSLSKDGGESLTIPQMVILAKRLAFYTSKVHPEVGGPDQVAVLEKGSAVRIEQPAFADPPPSILHFSLTVNSSFRHSSIVWARGAAAIFVRCNWDGMQHELDEHYFVDNVFTNSVLIYDGGVTSLGETNRVVNSVLVVGPHVKPDDQNVRGLIKAFSWSRVVYAPQNAKS